MKNQPPDERAEYPCHLGGDSSGWRFRRSIDMPVYFPCRTYDRKGKLVREELREPENLFESSQEKLREFDMRYTGHSGVDSEGFSR